jgi:hypothetical protein
MNMNLLSGDRVDWVLYLLRESDGHGVGNLPDRTHLDLASAGVQRCPMLGGLSQL